MKPTTDTTLALALALDGAATPATEEIKRLSGIAGMVDALPNPDIDARFAARLEATLMAEYDAKFGAPAPLRIVKPEPVARPTIQKRTAPNVVAMPQRRLVIRRAVAGLVAAAMLSALPVVAAASSLPGSPFFGIERWRQNHAISSAHGAEKAFTSERVAQKWIGYGAQMAVLNFDPSDIEAVLFRAGELQTQAAGLIARFGSKRQIATMAGMFAEDATRLREMLSRTSESARPAVHDAIATATSLTRSLVGSLRTESATVEIPAIAQTIAGDSTASPSGRSGTQAEPTRQGPSKSDPGTPTVKADPTRREYWDYYDRTACEMIAQEQANDLLAAPSKVVCTVRNLDPGTE
ncbi:MAG TPA: hypothetical protein VGB64_05460 [Actinomycetota bacterium]